MRTSGPEAFEAARALAAVELEPQRATAAALRLAGCDVPAEVYVFRGPRSHTGEDAVEYHVPGGPLVSRLLLEALRALGLRDAQPGEFTARAYLSGKLALDEAEAVQAAIAAENDAELLAASRLRAGELAELLQPATNAIAGLLAMCEAAIDFAAEADVVVLPTSEATRRAGEIGAMLDSLLAGTSRRAGGERPTIALVGRPNVGKSTLFNALVGRERVVASPLAGTTRDAVEADVTLGDVAVRLVDLPGIGDFDDPLDQAAADRARQRAAAADVPVLVTDRDATDETVDLPVRLRVRTKSDLLDALAASTDLDAGAEAPGSGSRARATSDQSFRSGVQSEAGTSGSGDAAGRACRRISAQTGAGIDDLRGDLARLASEAIAGRRSLLNDRHVACLRRAREAVGDAATAFADGDELAAVLLRDALDAVGEIRGVVTPDDVLGRVFAGFCVGK